MDEGNKKDVRSVRSLFSIYRKDLVALMRESFFPVIQKGPVRANMHSSR